MPGGGATARRASAFHAPAGDRFDLARATLTPLPLQRGGPGTAAAGKRRRGEQWARSGRQTAARSPPPPRLSRRCHVPSGHPGTGPGRPSRPDLLQVPQLRPGRRRAWAPAVGEGRAGRLGRRAWRDLYRRAPVPSLAPIGASRLAPPVPAQANQCLASP